jgi:hypothetical protein
VVYCSCAMVCQLNLFIFLSCHSNESGGGASPKRTPFRAFPVAARIVTTQAHTCGCRAAGSVLRACPEAGGTSPHGPPRSGRATGTHGPSGHVVRNTDPPSRLPIEAARNTTNGPLLPRCVVAYDIPGCL